MNLKKAIEIKEKNYKGEVILSLADYREADRLSIEALKRHRDKASLTYAGMLRPLAGETED